MKKNSKQTASKTQTTTRTEISAYSRLSVSKNRMTIVISVPCADIQPLTILDSYYEQTEKVAEYIETHQLEALV